VTLLGRNGAGKTTTLKSIMGMVGRRTARSASTDSSSSTPRRPDRPARHRRLPEERGIFAGLTSRRTCSCRRGCARAA
jgi:branched-chain amino acid transport system ATP-binding protein